MVKGYWSGQPIRPFLRLDSWGRKKIQGMVYLKVRKIFDPHLATALCVNKKNHWFRSGLLMKQPGKCEWLSTLTSNLPIKEDDTVPIVVVIYPNVTLQVTFKQMTTTIGSRHFENRVGVAKGLSQSSNHEKNVTIIWQIKVHKIWTIQQFS